MDCLASFQTNYDEAKMDAHKISGTKDMYGPLSSANTPILVAALKPLSSNTDSRSMLPTKHPPLHNKISTNEFY